ncbi:MAG: hypothetical protein U9N63_06005, partial [Pseudomonadota bacterium]|nr:hypothetical protein [Pseudomonadota bacterium]
MLIDVLSRFKVTFFIKLMIASSIVAVVGLLIFPGSVFSFGFSLAVHTLLAVALFWFMVKVVWPVRAGLDKIVFFVEKHKVSSDEEVN